MAKLFMYLYKRIKSQRFFPRKSFLKKRLEMGLIKHILFFIVGFVLKDVFSET